MLVRTMPAASRFWASAALSMALYSGVVYRTCSSLSHSVKLSWAEA